MNSRLVLVAIVVGCVSAQSNTYTFHQCNCGTSPCPTATNVPSGVCQNTIPFIDGQTESMSATCLQTTGQCAQVAFFNDNNCTEYLDFVSPVCGSCARIGDPSLASNGDMYAWIYVNCNSSDQSVTVQANCNAGCSVCKGTLEVHDFESCQPSASRFDTWVVAQGIVPCTQVQVQEWYNSVSCTGSPDVTRLVAQNYCAHGNIYACANQPTFTTPPGSTVLTSTCFDGCSYDCEYSTQPSGACVPFNGIMGTFYRKDTCDSQTSLCANMILFKDNQCAEFGDVFQFKCNYCAQMDNPFSNTTHYMFSNCLTNGSVIIYDCVDPLCNMNGCTARPTRNLFECALDPNPDPHHGQQHDGFMPFQSAMNYGVVQCATVSEGWYTTPDCSGPPVNQFDLGTGICSGHGRVSCGNFALQSVQVARCNCVVSSADSCAPQTISSSVCQPMMNGTTVMPGWSRQIDCSKTTGTCLRAAVFTDNQCTAFLTEVAPVCNACQKSLHAGYIKINCDLNNQMLSLNMNCNEDCSVCAEMQAKPSAIGECSPSISGKYYFRAFGFQECDVVRLMIWNSSSSCTGKPMAAVYRQAGVCDNGESITCASPPPLPGKPATANNAPLQVLHTTCADTTCGFGCNVTNRASGSCFVPGTPQNFGPTATTTVSRRLTCRGDRYCSDLIAFAGTTCTNGGFQGKLSVVCGVCQFWNTTWHRMQCDPLTQNVWWDMDCDATCTTCQNPGQFIRMLDSCTPAITAGQMVINTGVYPCTAVQIEDFTSDSCGNSSLLSNYSVAIGSCSNGESFACGSFSVPATYVANVTAQTCNCQGSKCPTSLASTFTTNTCQKFSTPNSQGFSTSIACPATAMTCAQFAAFEQSNCSNFMNVFSVVCNVCQSFPEGYVYHDCDAYNMKVRIYSGCNADCSQCEDPSATILAFLSVCAAVPGAHVKGMKLLSMRSCDAIIKMDYTNQQCQGKPLYVGMVQADWCMFNQYEFACSNAPSLAGFPANSQVLQTVCSDMWCAQNCVATVTASGKCLQMVGGGSQMFTCSQATGGMCLDFGLHPNGNCSGDNNFVPRSAVCNSCVLDPNDGGIYLVQCSASTSMVTITGGCDANCQKCTGVASAVPLNGCSVLTSSWSLRPWNLYACNSIQVQQYSGPSCSGPMTYSASVPDGNCGVGGRLMCGSAFSQDVITNPNMNRVEYFDCGCDANVAACGHATFQDRSCQSALQAPLGYNSTRVTCAGQGNCSTIVVYTGPGCVNYSASYELQCGGCAQFGTQYNLIQCNGASVSVLSCTDSACKQCAAVTPQPLDRCAPMPGVNGIYARSFGVTQCDLAIVEQWGKSTLCVGNPDNVITVAQSSCTMHGVFTCAKQVPVTPPSTTGSVLIQTCQFGSYCSKNCQATSVPQNECVTNELGGMTTQCLGTPGLCTTFGVFTDNACANQVNIVSIGCNTCQFFPAVGYYTYLRCDPVTNNVAFSTYCDSTCSRCENSDIDMRPQYTCVQGLNATHAFFSMVPYLVNYGVHECSQVRTNFYSSQNCAAGTLSGSVVSEAGQCSGADTVYTCGNYQMQTVTMSMCGGCGGQPCPPQQIFNVGTCQPYNTTSVKASCGTQQAMCANVIVFSGVGCQSANYLWKANPVCQSCMYTEDAGWLFTTCDMSNQQVSISKCNAQCAVCQTATDVHPYNQCSNGIITARSVFNLGTFPCDAVNVTWWSNTACTGQPMYSLLQAQGACAWGTSFLCQDAPYLSQPTQPAATQVLLQSCPVNSQAGPYCASSSCTTTVYQDGTCFGGNFLQQSVFGANSTQFVCHNERFCGTLEIFGTSTTCDGTPSHIFTIVCNTCAYFNGSYHNAICDMNSRTMLLLFDCDSQCQRCNQQLTRPRPEGLCEVDPRGGMVMLRTIFPCTAVEVHTYASNDCDPSTVIVNVTQSTGHCEFGHTFQCGTFNLPPTQVNQATVTQTDCFCSQQPGNTCAPTMNYTENTCQAVSNTMFSGSLSATCNAQIGMCAQVHFFAGPACPTDLWRGVNSVACGTCMKFFEGYARIICNDALQSVTVDSMCDATCSSCSPLATPHVFPMNNCVPSLRPGGYALVSGIAPCNTIEMIVYPDSTMCGALPGFVQTIAQDQCTPLGILHCSNAPAWPANQRFTQVIETFCPGDQFCNDGCTTTILNSGSCNKFVPFRNFGNNNNATPPALYSQVTCNAAPETCVTVLAYNGSSDCSNTAAIVNINSYVCGSCSWNDHFGIHFSVQCTGGNVIASNCTDSSCSSCTPILNMKPQQCVVDAFDSYSKWNPGPSNIYLRYHSTAPCNTVTFDLFSASTCAGTPIASFKHEAGMCNGIARYECGNNFNPALAPTPAPTAPGTGVFMLQLNKRYNQQTFAQVLQNALGVPFTSVVAQVSPDGLFVTFYFVGSSAAFYQSMLSRSLTQDAVRTASLFGAAVMTFIASGPTPTTRAPGGPSPASSDDSAKQHIIEAVVGGLAAVGILIVIVLIVRRRDRNVKGAVSRADIDDNQYEMYHDQH